jgi:hypothetical protein
MEFEGEFGKKSKKTRFVEVVDDPKDDLIFDGIKILMVDKGIGQVQTNILKNQVLARGSFTLSYSKY